tara:strand:- start:1338 stop:2018 length:681 start_codon:yes stop_codon:yes gene_type:complete
MPYLMSNVPYFDCWVRKEFTHNHEQYHGEFLHAKAIAVNTIPDRCLSFQVVFTGCESDFDDSENIHGGAMWARMPITALVADEPLEQFPTRMETHLAQPWDCSSHHHSVVILDRVSSSPWICKIDGEFYQAKYLFTVDYTESHISDDAAQHKQSHVLRLTDAGEWTGNIVALPNNRVRATSPALWQTGEGAPDFKPSQYLHSAEIHDSYLSPEITFNNLYAENKGD